MNSWVPKLLVSVTPPHAELSGAGRCPAGPTPLRQWYSSAKQPPGQRTLGTFNARRAVTTSLRMPRVFGIGESGPTQMPSERPCPRFSANWPKRLRSIFAPALDASMDKRAVSAALTGTAKTAAMKPKPSRSLRITSSSLAKDRQLAEWSKEDVAHSGRVIQPPVLESTPATLDDSD